jgi:hypothetical protein
VTSRPVPDLPWAVVLKSPALARWLLPSLGLAGLGYGLYLLTSAYPIYTIPFDDWAIVGIGGLCCVSTISAWRRRVVVDLEYTTKYWGTKVRRRCSNRDIAGIRTWFPGLSIIVFDNGSKIAISSGWTGQAEALQFFRTILDARTKRLSDRDEWLPLTYLQFPLLCVCCRAPEVVSQRISAGSVLCLGHAQLDRRLIFNVPICRACRSRRRRGGILYWALSVAFGVGIIATWILVWDSSFFAFVLFLSILIVFVNVCVNFVPRWANARFLGIAATKLKRDRTAVRLWFRDRQLEMEVRLLTESYRTKSLASAYEYLNR